MKSLFEQVKEAGVEYDNWSSDLYIPVNDVTTKLIENYEFKMNVTKFISQIDGKLWFDVPFAYEPHWESKTR